MPERKPHNCLEYAVSRLLCIPESLCDINIMPYAEFLKIYGLVEVISVDQAQAIGLVGERKKGFEEILHAGILRQRGQWYYVNERSSFDANVSRYNSLFLYIRYSQWETHPKTRLVFLRRQS